VILKTALREVGAAGIPVKVAGTVVEERGELATEYCSARTRGPSARRDLFKLVMSMYEC
jgi:hypothetical protein